MFALIRKFYCTKIHRMIVTDSNFPGTGSTTVSIRTLAFVFPMLNYMFFIIC
jgi:hypothetical protein